jgi:hypothetical protein
MNDQMRKKIEKTPILGNIYNFFIFHIKYHINVIKLKKEFIKFRKISEPNSRFELEWKDKYPCFNDDTNSTPFDQHYIYHLAWAARILAEIRPEYHVDISSSIYFSTIVSAFVPIKFYDYRPIDLHLSNLSSDFVDLVSMPFETGSIQSLSCMHTIEHVGLGRYGDTLDPEGDIKAINEIIRVLQPGGNLLFVVPVGKPKIMFNAHRIYSYDQILEYFKNLELIEYSLIPSNTEYLGFIRNANKEMTNKCEYGCGCFWFKKR